MGVGAFLYTKSRERERENLSVLSMWEDFVDT